MTLLRHHPQGETLMSWAAGTLDPAFSMVLDCHLQFCESCRASLRIMDDIGGLMLEGMTVGDDEAFFKRSMDRLAREVAQTRDLPQHGAAPDPGDDIAFPAPLARATGLRRDSIPWKDIGDGILKFDFPKFAGAAAAPGFVHLKPGAVFRSQKHGGQLAIVLWGAYEYNGVLYERGDLHDIGQDGFKTFSSASPEGATLFTAVSPVPQFEILRTAH
jgi:putative transcriptional regulator